MNAASLAYHLGTIVALVAIYTAVMGEPNNSTMMLGVLLMFAGMFYQACRDLWDGYTEHRRESAQEEPI